MITMRTFLISVLFLLSFSASAEGYDEKLKELFSLTGISTSYTNIHGYILQQLQASYFQAANQGIDANDLTDEQKKEVSGIVDEKFKQLVKDYEALVRGELPYDKAETEVYIPLFKEVYSEEEVDQLIVFYKSPVGKKSLETTTGILDKASEKISETFRPKIKEFADSKIPENIELVKKEMADKGIK